MSAIAIIRASLQDFRKSWKKLLISYVILSGIFLLVQYFLEPIFARCAFQYNEVLNLWSEGADITKGEFSENYGMHPIGIALYAGSLFLSWVITTVTDLTILLILKRPNACLKEQYRYFREAFFRVFAAESLLSLFSTAFVFVQHFFTGLVVHSDAWGQTALPVLVMLMFGCIFIVVLPFYIFYSSFWVLAIFEDKLGIRRAFCRCRDLLFTGFWRNIWTMIKTYLLISLPFVLLLGFFILPLALPPLAAIILSWALNMLPTLLLIAASRHIYLALNVRETFDPKNSKALSDHFQTLSQRVYDRKKEMGLLDENEACQFPEPIVGDPLWAADKSKDSLFIREEQSLDQQEIYCQTGEPLLTEQSSASEDFPDPSDKRSEI